MKISPIRNINTIKKQNNIIKNKIPKKVTLDNLPIVAGAIGFAIPLPLTSPIFFALGVIIKYVGKKFLHKA